MVLKIDVPKDILKDKTFKTRMLRYEIVRDKDGKFLKWRLKDFSEVLKK